MILDCNDINSGSCSYWFAFGKLANLPSCSTLGHVSTFVTLANLGYISDIIIIIIIIKSEFSHKKA